jgi:iron complex outermembrane receptor protein
LVRFRHGRLAARGTIRRTTRQGRTAPLEEPTPGFTLAEASVSYRIFSGAIFHDLTLVGSNLLDSAARLHTSFLKDVAPLPGREIRLVYRVNF